MLPQLEAQAVERPVTSFERYVLERLDQPPGDAWIDGLPLHVVMQSAALLGASMTRGHLARLSDLSDDERRESDNIGFEAVSLGEAGVRAALDAMNTAKTGGNAKGPTAMYGQIYYWLANANAEADFDPIRKIVTDHIVDTMPVGPGDRLFGKEVSTRKVHSVWSASRQYKMDRDRLRLMLIEMGWVPARSNLPFNWQTFDAVKSEQFLKDAKSSLNYLQALKYLNAPKAHEPILVASGLLKPWIAAGSSGLKDHAFLPRDLDAFLLQLTRAADERYSDDPSLMNISAAQKRVFCGAEAIVRLILEGKLQRVGKRIGVEGYNSVLVDPREVEALVLTRDRDLLSVKEAAAMMRAPVNSVHALIEQKILPAVDGRHPKTNRPMKIVSRSAIEQFLSSYIPLAEAAKLADVSWGTFRKRQNSRGVAAAFERPGGFYRREDLKDQIP
ncbi:DNA-binding protein [Hansschlegelia zhihuaiae]|uniref:DNA-binding protein n=2 Tax=Hansschlegelia zhihuaiae TaxID=405005 RepID=A0A4V1KHP9_9HYPH|nr:DNA-binding protein [Hansschlegelia zhihuaiae]